MDTNNVKEEVKDLKKAIDEASVLLNNDSLEYPIVKVDEKEFCKLNVHYEGDPEIVSSKIDEAVAQLRKIKVSGFRKGKAPDNAIKARLKPQISQFVAREMATHAIDDIVFETNIKPIGQPKFSNVSIKGNNFSCDIELNKKPEFEVNNFKFDVSKPKIETDEESIAKKSFLNLRVRVGDVEPYEENDVVEIGDQVTLSFEATIDGDSFDGSIVEGQMYEVGKGQWSGFDDNIIGMKAGEERDFDLTFESGPDELSGKTAKFHVTIHMGTKRKPHPVNDEFFEKMGVPNAEELMDKLKSIARLSIKRNEQEAIRSQVAGKLIEDNDFKVPEFMVKAESENIALHSGLKFEELNDSEKESIVDKANKSIKLTLILDTIRDNEPDSVLNDNEAHASLKQQIQMQGHDPDQFINNPAVRPQLLSLLSSIKDEFTLQWVADQANIIEEK